MYETLVRDGEPHIRTASEAERSRLLLAKLTELVAAHRVEPSLERLADMAQAVEDLSGDPAAVRDARARLARERGTFSGGRVAVVEGPHTHAEGALAQVSVKAAVVHDGRLLCARKRDEFGGQWEIPGGRLGLGDAPEEKVVEEIAEELGIEGARVGEHLASGFADALAGFLPMFYLVYAVDVPHTDVVLSDEHVEWAWLSGDDVRVMSEDGRFNPSLGRMLAGARLR